MHGVAFHSREPFRAVVMWMVLASFPLVTIPAARAEFSERNRVADSAKVGLNNIVSDCPGKLFETYMESVDENGWTYWLRLTCASSPTTAEWSLIANSKCFEDTGKVCSSPTAKLIPPFSAPSILGGQPRQTFVSTISF
jgi:hypothetical protein